jgi:hypothetical protein
MTDNISAISSRTSVATSSSSTSSSSDNTVSSECPERTRKLGFAFSTPTTRDGAIIYTIGRIAAWLSRRQLACKYSHCELYFDDERCFGITSVGLHFYKRTLALDEYTFYGLDVPESKYLELLRLCEQYRNDRKLVFSSAKAVLTHLICTSWFAYDVYPKHYTYCSELLARVLRDSGVLPYLRVSGATPNDIAECVLRLVRNGTAYITLGPALTAHHNDEHV